MKKTNVIIIQFHDAIAENITNDVHISDCKKALKCKIIWEKKQQIFEYDVEHTEEKIKFTILSKLYSNEKFFYIPKYDKWYKFKSVFEKNNYSEIEIIDC